MYVTPYSKPYSEFVFVPGWNALSSIVSFALRPLADLFWKYEQKKTISSAPGHYLLGSYPEFWWAGRDIINFTISYNGKYASDGLCRLKFGPLSYIIVSDPRKAALILKEPKAYIRGDGLKVWQKFSPGGLSEGPDTTQFRQMAQKAIGHGAFKNFFPNVMQAANSWVRSIKDDTIIVDAHGEASKVTLAAMGESIFRGPTGANPFEIGNEGNAKFLEAYEVAFGMLINWMVSPLANFPKVGNWLYDTIFPHEDRAIKDSVATITSILTPIFEKGISEFKAGNPKAKEMFDNFMLDPTELDVNKMVQMSIGFLHGSFGTTSMAYGWATYFLGKHPEIQEKLRRDLQEQIIGREPENIDDLEKVPYLSMFIEEVLRFCPSFPFLMRDVVEPKPVDGYEVFTGESFLISPLICNHNAECWSNPEEFRPERWTEEMLTNKWQRDNPEYLTFLQGNHACPGRYFAKQQLAILVFKLLTNFKVELVDPSAVPEFLLNITLHSKEPIKIRLQRI